MSKKEILNPETIDWKISKSVDRYPIDKQQFTSLSVKATKEVVSLDFTEHERDAALKGTFIIISYLFIYFFLLILQ